MQSLSAAIAKVLYEPIYLAGGLDQVTPSLRLKNGYVRDAVNWECSITGGYTRIAGYERFDGRPNPSDAIYSALTVVITGTLSVGNTVTGATSAATGVILLVNGTTIILSKLTGSFASGEALKVGGVTQATISAIGAGYTITPLLNASYLGLAADLYRADIGTVPGSGPIRGVAYFKGIVYAWRDNVGATALGLYKSTSSGWSSVSLGIELRFTSGLAAGINEGDTVTGLTSGATGVVKRVAVQDGTFAANSAAGSLIFASVTGTFSAAENLRVAGTNRATCSGAQTAITLLPGGRVQTVVGNFGGSTNTTRLYGCDGQNRAFEFDGTVYVPISTGMTVDVPSNIAVHKLHLFLSFGSSVQFSGIGTPYLWSPVFGAGEIALIDDVTCFLSLPGDQTTGALAIYSNSYTGVLYGSSSSDFDLKPFSDGSGAKQYSAQNIGTAFVFDTKGISSLASTPNYGNFSAASLSLNIRPFVQQRRNLVSASCVNREKSQYRVFFSDGYCIYMTVINGKVAGSMPMLFPQPVSCITAGETADGTETSFFGSTDGRVYRLDAGTSFDGGVIDSYFVLTWDSVKSPRTIKRYRKASVEITGNSYAEFGIGYQLAYGSSEVDQNITTTNTTASYWDDGNWDSFYWDGRTLAPSEVDLLGSAENLAIRINSSSAIFEAFTMNSIIVHYSLRRGIR